MTICGKMVDDISGHKQFDVASVISNFLKVSLKIPPFATVKKEYVKRTFGSVNGDVTKSNGTKNTIKMLRYLLVLIYYSNTIFGNISGKNEFISLCCTLKCNGAQDDFVSFNFRLCRCRLSFDLQ